MRSFVLALGIAGCNALLDNKPGRLGDTVPTTEVTPTQSNADSGPTDVPDNNQPEDAGEPVNPGDGGLSSPQCAPSQHMCLGFCVGLNDPAYGCGSPSCEPCKSPHGTPTCQGNKCVVQACDKGYADCNQNPNDGCEVDLSKATSCGRCNAVCPAANPVCAPSGGSFECTTGCGPAAPLLCGIGCVSPLTNVNHCGGCGKSCNGGTCNNGVCMPPPNPDAGQ